MIVIQRSTGFSGSYFKAKIYIDGQEVARIKEGQQIELELPNDDARIYVSQFENHNNELLVKDGQVLEITNSPWFYFNFIFVILAIMLVIIFMPANYRTISLFGVVLLSIALAYFENGFELKVIDP